MKAVIILGCEGRQNEGFCFCTGTRNIIVDLEEIRRTANYVDLVKYLDGVPHVFDSPCFKSHIISNAVYKIYEMGYIKEKVYQNIAHFYEMHKRCGLILKACAKGEDDGS